MNFPGFSVFTSEHKAGQRIDPWAFLMEKKRMLFLGGLIEISAPAVIGGAALLHMSAQAVVDCMLALDALGNEPIKLLIDSPGGGAETGLMIYDTMQAIRSPVYTIGRASCASMAAVLLASGAPGHRYAFPNCVLMLHMGRGGAASGDRKEREVREKNIQEYERRIADIIRRHCGKNQSANDILREWFEESELWMFADKALEYGLIDKIITPEIYREELLGEN